MKDYQQFLSLPGLDVDLWITFIRGRQGHVAGDLRGAITRVVSNLGTQKQNLERGELHYDVSTMYPQQHQQKKWLNPTFSHGGNNPHLQVSHIQQSRLRDLQQQVIPAQDPTEFHFSK
jgi:hypothetical protein